MLRPLPMLLYLALFFTSAHLLSSRISTSIPTSSTTMSDEQKKNLSNINTTKSTINLNHKQRKGLHCLQVRPLESIVKKNVLTGHVRYHFNTRMFCMTSNPICVSTYPRATLGTVYYHTSDRSSTSIDSSCSRATTTLVDDDTSATDIPISCERMRRSVFCSTMIKDGYKQRCPVFKTMNEIESSLSRWSRLFNWNRISMKDSTQSVNWIPQSSLMVVVPAYEHLYNIYHYVHVINHVMHIIASARPLMRKHLYNTNVHSIMKRDAVQNGSTITKNEINNQRIKVTILFRGDLPSGFGAWQDALTSSLVRYRLNALGYDVDIISLYEDRFQPYFRTKSSKRKSPRPRTTSTKFKASSTSSHSTKTSAASATVSTVCGHRAIILGYRNSIAWPFANHATFSSHEHALTSTIPVEAVLFKASVYSSLNLSFSTSSTICSSTLLQSDINSLPDRLLLDLPPLALGYSRRNTDRTRDPSSTGGTLILGRARRFSEPDEAWFLDMLHRQSKKWDMPLHILSTPRTVGFTDQVVMFKRVGVVVGIHGANLVNALFMHPFGGLVELSNDNSQCYFKGANSGLSYWHFKPSRVASVKESFCHPSNGKCKASVRNRRIMMENGRDRERVQAILRTAIERIVLLHKMFNKIGGVPVRLNRITSEYEIEWPD